MRMSSIRKFTSRAVAIAVALSSSVVAAQSVSAGSYIDCTYPCEQVGAAVYGQVMGSIPNAVQNNCGALTGAAYSACQASVTAAMQNSANAAAQSAMSQCLGACLATPQP